MIVSGTSPSVTLDYGEDKPGRQEREGGVFVWNDYLVDSKAVKSPVDIDDLPTGVYRLI